MAQKSKTGNYLNLEDVRVSYDPKSDMFSVTAADSELKELGGLKLDVSHSSKAYNSLKALLKSHGVIRGNPWPRISMEESWDLFRSEGDPRNIPIATNLNGELYSWSIDDLPNLWAFGMGTSFIKRTLISHALIHEWDLYTIDTTQVELPRKLESASSPDGILLVLKEISDLIDERYAVLENQGIYSHKDVAGDPFRTVLLVIEEIKPLLDLAGGSKGHWSKIGNRIIELINRIGSRGRIVDVHLSLSVGRPSAELEEQLQNHIPFENRWASYVILGRAKKENLPSELHSYEPFRSFMLFGRAHFVSYTDQTDIQVLAFPIERLDELIESSKPANVVGKR